jgi:hypothetical protein
MPDETRYAMPCPTCGTPMPVVAIEPAWSVLGADEITYRCGACNYEEKLIQQAEKP